MFFQRCSGPNLNVFRELGESLDPKKTWFLGCSRAAGSGCGGNSSSITIYHSPFTWHRKGCANNYLKDPQGMVWFLKWTIYTRSLNMFLVDSLGLSSNLFHYALLSMWWYFLRSCSEDTRFCRENICNMIFIGFL